MKIKVYGVRQDEVASFEKYGKKYGHEISLETEELSLATVEKAKGFKGVSFLENADVNKEVLTKLAEYGIHYIASRAPRVSNVDFEAAKELNIKVSNVPAFSTNAVSEFVVMAGLTLLRNLPEALLRVKEKNYSLGGLMGREMRDQTVGVIGTGRIGREAARAFKALGAKVIGHDMYPDKATSQYLKYETLENIFAQADIISLHCPLTEENYHMINKASIATMKDHVIIINTASAGLVDTAALKDGLSEGKIAGVALDKYENDEHTLLDEFTNVIVTPHFAYYTDEAVANMVDFSLDSLKEFEEKGYSNYEVNASNK